MSAAGAPSRGDAVVARPDPRLGVDATRATDVALSALGLLVSAPAMAVIAAAVRLGSPGPVLFRQRRVGRAGVPFDILKFRTMTVRPDGHDGPLVSATGDARVTRVGRLLRRTKLDELPQLVNVLRGEMSLVGPRPEVPRYVRVWEPAARDVILSVRPGITDPASILGRDEGDELAAQPDPERYYVETLLPRKTALYVDYVHTRTWRGDLTVLARTIVAVVAPAGARR